MLIILKKQYKLRRCGYQDNYIYLFMVKKNSLRSEWYLDYKPQQLVNMSCNFCLSFSQRTPLFFKNSTKSWSVEVLDFYFCLSVWVYVCLCICEQNADRTTPHIFTWSLLNSCLRHWLGPYWYWWPWVKGQGHSDNTSIFSWFSGNFPTLDFSSLLSKQ